MSPQDLLQHAIRRGMRTKIPGRAIPIQQIEEQIPVPVKVVEKPEPPKPVVIPDPPPPRFPSVRAVVETVAKHYGIEYADIASARRYAAIVFPRHVACYLCRKLTIRSYPEIGRFLGDRDHTTILHGSRRIEALLAGGDEKLAADIEAIKQKLGSGGPPSEPSAPADCPPDTAGAP